MTPRVSSSLRRGERGFFGRAFFNVRSFEVNAQNFLD